MSSTSPARKQRSYVQSLRAAQNHPAYYRLEPSLNPERYRPMAAWMGRLILPTPAERRPDRGVWIEVYHAPPAHHALVGQQIWLRWSEQPDVQARVWAVTRHVFFNQNARQSVADGLVMPERLNGWQLVGPLESLAGAHPVDDIVVALRGEVHIQQGAHGNHETALAISREPVQISGRFYALVTILGAEAQDSDRYRVAHFNRATRQFDGPEEIVRLPVVVRNENGLLPATNQNIEHSLVNAEGWYICGAQDRAGCFVVQSLVPRALLRVQPQQTITKPRQARTYLKQTSWENIVTRKGQVGSVLLAPQADSAEQALAEWQVGDRALLVHVYGGIGGSKREPAARTGLYFGHFAYGIAEVIREPLADELLFQIEYEQVYTHNGDGLVAGTLDWTRYMGDRQYGWLGIRPVCDILIKLDAFTTPYRVGETHRSGLDVLARMLETMTARYRIGDGTGGTYVAAANNCAQDSNQALYGAIKQIEAAVNARPDVHAWLATSSPDVERFKRLLRLNNDLHRKLLPLGTARADWQYQAETLGISLEEHPLRNVLTGLRSWRTMLPRVANNVVGEVFLSHGASIWVLSMSQVGGHHPDIEPLPPLAW